MSKTTPAGTPRLATLKYLVSSVLETDGNSSVLLVTEKQVGGGRYALKIIKREEPGDDLAIERARAEAVASEKLNHPAVLKTHDFRTRKSWFRVYRAEQLMEHVDGKPLGTLGVLDIGPRLVAAHQLAGALAHMHRRGVLHGSLTPTNVLVGRAGSLKVRGYGLSQVADAFRPQVKPDPGYAAPEQVKGHVLDEKTDLYALGATLYHALTGRPPAGVYGRTESHKVPLPSAINPKISTPLNNLLVACLQSNPDKRPPDVYEVVKTLETMVKERSLDASALRGLAAEEAE